MGVVINLKEKSIEKQYEEMMSEGSAALYLKEEETYWRKQKERKDGAGINKQETRRDMIKGYMSLLSK